MAMEAMYVDGTDTRTQGAAALSGHPRRRARRGRRAGLLRAPDSALAPVSVEQYSRAGEDATGGRRVR